MCKTFFAAQKSLNKSLIGRVTRCRGRKNVRLAGNLSARSMMLFAFLYLRTQRIPVFILSFSYIYFLINFPVCLLVFSCSSCLPPFSSPFISLHSSSPCSVIPPLPLSLVLLLFHHFFVFSYVPSPSALSNLSFSLPSFLLANNTVFTPSYFTYICGLLLFILFTLVSSGLFCSFSVFFIIYLVNKTDLFILICYILASFYCFSLSLFFCHSSFPFPFFLVSSNFFIFNCFILVSFCLLFHYYQQLFFHLSFVSFTCQQNQFIYHYLPYTCSFFSVLRLLVAPSFIIFFLFIFLAKKTVDLFLFALYLLLFCLFFDYQYQVFILFFFQVSFSFLSIILPFPHPNMNRYMYVSIYSYLSYVTFDGPVSQPQLIHIVVFPNLLFVFLPYNMVIRLGQPHKSPIEITPCILFPTRTAV